ncbi:MAG: hypothetical protein ACQEQM_08005 [Thermoplasmatota archaeon]
MKISYETKDLMIISLVVAIINVTVPYLVLKDYSVYWANFVFWTVLTLLVMFIGYLYIKEWGDSE